MAVRNGRGGLRRTSRLLCTGRLRRTFWAAGTLCALAIPTVVCATEPDGSPLLVASAHEPSDAAPKAEVRGAAATPPAPEDTKPAAKVAVVYQPPRRGAPRINVGAGGVRGTVAQPRLLVLAPDHVGLTEHAAPSLFWHIDALPGEDLAVVFTLVDGMSAAPLVERKLPSPTRAGIQRLRLDRLGVELQPGIDYEWSIALVDGDELQPQVAVTVGYIRRVAPDEDPAAGGRDGAAYAQAGIWYDALAALGDAIDARPDDTDLRFMRNSLLRQGKLETAIE